jgi:hypothetical protein
VDYPLLVAHHIRAALLLDPVEADIRSAFRGKLRVSEVVVGLGAQGAGREEH